MENEIRNTQEDYLNIELCIKSKDIDKFKLFLIRMLNLAKENQIKEREVEGGDVSATILKIKDSIKLINNIKNVINLLKQLSFFDPNSDEFIEETLEVVLHPNLDKVSFREFFSQISDGLEQIKGKYEGGLISNEMEIMIFKKATGITKDLKVLIRNIDILTKWGYFKKEVK